MILWTRLAALSRGSRSSRRCLRFLEKTPNSNLIHAESSHSQTVGSGSVRICWRSETPTWCPHDAVLGAGDPRGFRARAPPILINQPVPLANWAYFLMKLSHLQ